LLIETNFISGVLIVAALVGGCVLIVIRVRQRRRKAQKAKVWLIVTGFDRRCPRLFAIARIRYRYPSYAVMDAS